MKNENKTKLIILLVTIFVILAVCVIGIIIKNSSSDSKPANGGSNETGVTNLDGTPVEVEPYVDEEGKPVVNEDGYQVYQVKNTYDENGDPVLVTKGVSTNENEFVYIIQIKTDDGTIKNKTDENGEEQTTVFEGNPSKIPEATNDSALNNSATNGGASNNSASDGKNENTSNGSQSEKDNTAATTNSQTQKPTESRELPDTIELGGVFGTVTKDKSKGENIYKGHFVESELTTLKTPVTYSNINATFTKGVYVPEKIGDYTVVQIAYVRLYTYYDEAFGEYDWYSERGIFKPGNDNDPVVYIGKNDTFDPGDDAADIHSLFLIELA